MNIDIRCSIPPNLLTQKVPPLGKVTGIRADIYRRTNDHSAQWSIAYCLLWWLPPNNIFPRCAVYMYRFGSLLGISFHAYSIYISLYHIYISLYHSYLYYAPRLYLLTITYSIYILLYHVYIFRYTSIYISLYQYIYLVIPFQHVLRSEVIFYSQLHIISLVCRIKLIRFS